MAALPATYSTIISDFGGTSLLTAGANIGLSAPVSFSDFENEGSGSFTAAFNGLYAGNGFAIIAPTFGTSYSLAFCNGGAVGGIWQDTNGTRPNDFTIYGYGSTSGQETPNTDATFYSVNINGVKRYRSQATYSFTSTRKIWFWNDVPVGTIVVGQNYVPIWRTS